MILMDLFQSRSITEVNMIFVIIVVASIKELQHFPNLWRIIKVRYQKASTGLLWI
jgi:hypothetical protein